jgi:hypothetical protein
LILSFRQAVNTAKAVSRSSIFKSEGSLTCAHPNATASHGMV